MSLLTPHEATSGLHGVARSVRRWSTGADRARLENHLTALAGLVGERPRDCTLCESPAEAIELLGQVEALLLSQVVTLSPSARHEREAIAALVRVVTRSLQALPYASAAAMVEA